MEEKLVNSNEIKQALYTCSKCKKFIYDKDDAVIKKIEKKERLNNPDRIITTTEDVIFCKECDKKEQNEIKASNIKNQRLFKNTARKRLVLAIIFGTLFAVIPLLVGIFMINNDKITNNILYGSLTASLGTISIFTMVACMFLYNNFIIQIFVKLFTLFRFTAPGIIFSFDADGLKFLIAMKILFAIIGFVIALLCFLLAICVSAPLSLIVFPFAVYKNIVHPEDSF